MPKKQVQQEMNWIFLIFKGHIYVKKGSTVQSSPKITQLLDPLFTLFNETYLFLRKCK